VFRRPSGSRALPRSSGITAALIAAFALLLFCAAAFALTFPVLSGRVVDEAGILDAVTKTSLEQKLADLETKTANQLVVVTLKSLQGTSIEDYGYQLGRHWGIGQKGSNNGALLIVAPNDRKARIEVGYGLEGTLTDAVTRLILENAVLPRFRANDYAGGVTRGVDDIVSALSGNADEFKQRAAQRPDAAPKGIDPLVLIIIAVVVFLVLRSMLRGVFGGFGARGRRRSSAWGAAPIFFPGASGGSWGSGSGWDSGSSGGGFSGGGGSFGGGGSSGSW
jgi:uncharacterized protein